MINHDPHKNKVKITHFFNKTKNNTNKYHTRNQPLYYAQIYFPSDDEEYYNQNHQRFYLGQRPRSYSIDHTHEMNKHDNPEITQHLTTIIFNKKPS